MILLCQSLSAHLNFGRLNHVKSSGRVCDFVSSFEIVQNLPVLVLQRTAVLLNVVLGMADRRRTDSPAVRARASRGGEAAFEEQERARIKQLKENLLRMTSPSPALSSNFRYDASPIAQSQSSRLDFAVAPVEEELVPVSAPNMGHVGGRAYDGKAAGPVEIASAQDVIRDESEDRVVLRKAPLFPLSSLYLGLYTDHDSVCCRCVKSLNGPSVVLTCAHRICSTCAKELFEFSTAVETLARQHSGSASSVDIRCLDCGSVTSVPDLASLLARKETATPQVVCCQCSTAAATVSCQNCIAPFCDACCKDFHSREHFQKHKWQDLQSLSAKRRCAQHNKALDMFCTGCIAPACSRCFLADDGAHRGHTATPLMAAAAPVSEGLRSDIAVVKSAADRLNGHVASLKDVSHSVIKVRLS